MNLFILKYNNYYNRQVKRHSELNDYIPYIKYSQPNINFNPNDGVDTEYVFGTVNNPYDGTGDYLLIVEDGKILSRWFIIETRRTRGAQFNLILHRDLVADYYDSAVNSPCFIEKATLPETDSFIFNKEDFSVNQIKTSQSLLYDTTRSPWIVGYLDPQTFASDTTITSIVSPMSGVLDNYEELYQYTQQPNRKLQYMQTKTLFVGDGVQDDGNIFVHKYRGYNVSLTFTPLVDQSTPMSVGYGLTSDTRGISPSWYCQANQFSQWIKAFADISKRDTVLLNRILAGTNTTQLNLYQQYNGRTVRKSTQSGDEYYTIHVDRTWKSNASDITTGVDYSSRTDYPIYTQIKADAEQAARTISSSGYYFGGLNFTYNYYYYEERVRLVRVYPDAYTTTFKTTTRLLDDSPYAMFAMKYQNLDDLKLAMSIGTGLGSKCYDIQVLPFCPVQDYLIDGEIDNSILTHQVDYVQISRGSTAINKFIYFCPKSQFRVEIPYTIDGITDVKVRNQCDMYRLVAPNGASAFEFNAVRNGGVNYFECDCYYRPINPYVHIAPNFGKLYGSDFDDYRGLIFQGDFSIPKISDRWVEYEIANKNYQNIFNRQIQNLEVSNAIQREYDKWSAITGAFSGAGIGASAGAMLGGVPGAIVGGLAGGALSGLGGAIDYKYKEKLRNEQLDYTKDMYSYQLQNIQALPNCIAKTGCLSPNNPLIPYLEYYTCTEEEKTAFRNKLKYNGMTVMRIGTVFEFIQPEESYIKGKLIRVEDVDEDMHLINSLAEEINKGVFI